VTLQLDTLSQGVSPDQIQTTLDSLPRTLDSLYGRMLLEIDPAHQKHAIAGLQWLSSSARPLYLDELTEAISMTPNEPPIFSPQKRLWDISEILRILPAGLVTVTRDASADTQSISQSISDNEATKLLWARGINDQHSILRRPAQIQFAHFSVKEYLVSTRLSQGRASKYFVNEILAHRVLSEICLLYLSEVADLRKPLSQNLKDYYPLLGYCCRCWPHHVEKLEQDIQHFPNPSLYMFLKGNNAGFKMWAMPVTAQLPLTIYQDKRACSPAGLINLKYEFRSNQLAPPALYVAWLGLGKTLKSLLEQDVVPLQSDQGWPYGNPLHIASNLGVGSK